MLIPPRPSSPRTQIKKQVPQSVLDIVPSKELFGNKKVETAEKRRRQLEPYLHSAVMHLLIAATAKAGAYVIPTARALCRRAWILFG